MRYQYQQRADPLRSLAVTSADKWQPTFPDAVRRPATIVLLVTGIFAPVARPPAVTVEQWSGFDDLPPRSATPRQSGIVVTDPVGPLRRVAAGDWQGFDDLPPRTFAPRQTAGPAAVDPLVNYRTVAAGDWQGFDDLPPKTYQPRQTAGQATIDPLLNLRAVTAADWQGAWTQPDRTPHLPREGQSVTDPAGPLRIVGAADWQPRWVQPDRPLPKPPQGQGLWEPTAPPAVTVDQWLGSGLQPSRVVRIVRAEQPAIVQVVAAVAAETITVDKWYAVQPQPQPLPRRPDGVAVTRVANPPAITPDQWLGAWTQPQQTRPAQPGFVAPVLGEVITADKWLGTWTQPQRVRPAHPGFFSIAVGEVVTADKWFGCLSQPVVTAKPRQAGQSAIVEVVSAPAETITADKWLGHWPQPDRTPHAPARNETFGPVVYFNVPSFDWFVSQPIRVDVKSRRGEGFAGQQFTAVLTTPATTTGYLALTNGVGYLVLSQTA